MSNLTEPLRPHPKQAEIIKSPARFKITRAGRRSGKTKLKVETLFFKAVSNSIILARRVINRNLIFIAPTQKQARTIVWDEFKRRIGDIGEYNESRLEIRVPNQEGGFSTIFIGGWENRENYRGMPDVVHIEFDEVDTMRDFFIGWQEIFRPMLIDTGGSVGFGGTPKKENPNLRRLEQESKHDPSWASFHFTTRDNPYISHDEIEKTQKELDATTFKQEILAEYVENQGALFQFSALVDMFSNTIEKDKQRYLSVDIADDGTDKGVFGFWQGLECYRFELFERLNTEGYINQIREYAAQEKIPFSHIIVDANGVGAGVASSSLLNGIVGYKSSFQAMKTDDDITKLPGPYNIPLFTEYRNLRSQCVFTLANLVNEHEIAVRTDAKTRERIIEELSQYQDISTGDGKRLATHKEDIRATLGRSPDLSDTLLMRMYFHLKDKVSPEGEDETEKEMRIKAVLERNAHNIASSGTR